MRTISREGFVNRLLARSVFGWTVEELWRRAGWMLEGTTPRKILHGAIAAQAYLRKAEIVRGVPPIVKIDISPMCNLKCTVCVHAMPNGNPNLESQRFDAAHRMTTRQFRKIIEEISGKASAVSLYYLGDPIVHPDLDEMCRIARAAGLNVHISTNFSIKLSDERIRSIVESGLTHLSVCVDGLSQEKYELTRVGGRIDRVMSNLERACRVRDELGAKYPRIEVQFIKFRHNVGELDAARRRFAELGVDQFTDFWGSLHNYTDTNPGQYPVFGPKKETRTPRCAWPYYSTLIRYDGDVIPCCHFRLGTQYVENGEVRSLGNVFSTSLEEVWNSSGYRAARRLVSNPERIHREHDLTESFCHGCPKIFHTGRDARRRSAQDHDWEDLYELGERGFPKRRSLPLAPQAESGSVRPETAR